MMNQPNAVAEPETALRVLGVLSMVAGVVPAVVFGLEVYRTQYVTASGGVPIPFGHEFNIGMLGLSIGCLASGFITALLFTKFAIGLELVKAIHARQC